MKSKSKDAFNEHALRILTEKQGKHSKLEKLMYTEVKQQNYLTLEKLTKEEIRNIFKHRVRMAPYEENVKDGREHVVCPLGYSRNELSMRISNKKSEHYM